jgi:hypothetical protein
MPEGGDPKRKGNPSKMDNPETLALATMSTQTSRWRQTKIIDKKYKQKTKMIINTKPTKKSWMNPVACEG